MQQGSEEKYRSFIALQIPDDVKSRVSEIQGRLRGDMPSAKWVKPNALHFTLKFLGDVSVSRIEDVKDVLKSGIKSSVFEMSPGGLGVFPHERKARVLWIGLQSGAAECIELAGQVEDVLLPVGFQKEKKKFTAHLTLARFRNPVKLENGLPDIDIDVPSFRVDKVVLYRSILKSSGAEYSELASFPLK